MSLVHGKYKIYHSVLCFLDVTNLRFEQHGACAWLAPCKIQALINPLQGRTLPPPAKYKICIFACFSWQKQDINLNSAFKNIIWWKFEHFCTKYSIFSIFSKFNQKLVFVGRSLKKKLQEAPSASELSSNNFVNVFKSFLIPLVVFKGCYLLGKLVRTDNSVLLMKHMIFFRNWPKVKRILFQMATALTYSSYIFKCAVL